MNTANNDKTIASSGEGALLSGPHNHVSLERMLFFSDGVFAIAITFLALELRLPPDAVEHLTTNFDLWAAIGHLWPKYLSFLVSFLVIGLYWMSHHRMFRLINKSDDRLLWLNLLFLLCIAVIPYPTSILGEFVEFPAAVILYAGTQAATGLIQLSMWIYATGSRRLVESHLNDGTLRRIRAVVTTRMCAPVVVFLLSMAIAMDSPVYATFSWILIAPILLLINRIGSRTPPSSGNHQGDNL